MADFSRDREGGFRGSLRLLLVSDEGDRLKDRQGMELGLKEGEEVHGRGEDDEAARGGSGSPIVGGRESATRGTDDFDRRDLRAQGLDRREVVRSAGRGFAA